MTPIDPNTAKPVRTLWPHAIVAWFIIFASALAAWIAFAVRQNMDLVRRDYYEEEIRFQTQLDRLNRTAPIHAEIALCYEAARNKLRLRLPAAHAAQHPVGRVQFYRPSDAALDVELPLAIDNAGLQSIDTRALRGGQWRIRVQWTVAGQDYFFEQAVVLDETADGLAGKHGNTK